MGHFGTFSKMVNIKLKNGVFVVRVAVGEYMAFRDSSLKDLRRVFPEKTIYVWDADFGWKETK